MGYSGTILFPGHHTGKNVEEYRKKCRQKGKIVRK
jgi:hypothetical protein